nr:reverse transcriptase domain-containing protein [Tanacetum cinerariifolium]
MKTRSRKNSIAKPAPPVRDPRDVETTERLQQRIQELELQQLRPDSPAEEAKNKPNVWDDEPVDVNPLAEKTLENHRQEAFLDYHNLSQQNMTVEEVINKFDKLRMMCDVVEEEEQVIAWFLGVLKPEMLIFRFTPPTTAASPIAPKTAPKATTPTTLAAGPIYDTDAEPELDEPDDGLVYPDCREALV